MTLELTEQQRQVVEEQAGHPVEVVDPRTQRTYVLIAHEQYEKVRLLLEGAEGLSSTVERIPVMSPGMRRSQEQYWQDLPQLLKQKKLTGQWVCYHGSERVGIAKSKSSLAQVCLRRGLERGTFYVGRIKERPIPPWEPEEMDQSLYEFEDESHPSSSPSPR